MWIIILLYYKTGRKNWQKDHKCLYKHEHKRYVYRRSRCVYDNDTNSPTPTQNSRITKRTKLDCDTCLRTTSSDSGISTTETFSDLSANINSPPSPSNGSRVRPRSGLNLDFWWAKNERVRRLSTESIVSVDSITKEINKTWHSVSISAKYSKLPLHSVLVRSCFLFNKTYNDTKYYFAFLFRMKNKWLVKPQ